MSVILGAFIGVAAVFGLISLALYPLMRRSFLLWNFGRTFCFGAIAFSTLPATLTSPGFLGITLSQFGDIGVALSGACAGPFLASYLEPKFVFGRLRTAMRWAALPGVLAAVATLAAKRWPVLDAVHGALLLIVIAIVTIGLVFAIRRGSRAARYQALAWAPLIAIGSLLLVYELVTGQALWLWSLAVLLAMNFDFIITARGLVDGFMIVKRERDEAWADVREAKRVSTLDPLTGIANRRGLAQRFDDPSHGRPQGLAVIDCDHFKRVNDNYGHDMGDEVLVAVAKALQGEDLYIGRLGGEEFVALVYHDDWQAVAKNARARVAMGVRIQSPKLAFAVTASAGLARVHDDDTLASAIKRADRALYAAKDAGRDCSYTIEELEGLQARLAHG